MKTQIEKIKNAIKEIKEFAKQNEGLAILIEQEAESVLAIKNNNDKLKPLSISEVENIFGKFEYSDIGNGRIRIDGDWQYENIKLLQVGHHKVWIHKLIFPQTAYVFAKIYSEGLENDLDLSGGGGFCARHMNWNNKNPLSLHAFGCAIDLNPEKYPYGSNNQPHPRLIEIFNESGFYWGGNFSTPDPMHLQFSRFMI